MSGKKFLTPEVWKKNRSQTNSSIPLSLQKSNGQPHEGWGKKRIWNFSNWHPSTKWLAHVHHGWSKVLYFKIENTRIKDTNEKRKFKRMLSFLFASLPRNRFFWMSRNALPKVAVLLGERCVTSKNGCEGDYLFVDKRELFAMKLSFEAFNLVFCTADQSA